jgi:hypothetical protein
MGVRKKGRKGEGVTVPSAAKAEFHWLQKENQWNCKLYFVDIPKLLLRYFLTPIQTKSVSELPTDLCNRQAWKFKRTTGFRRVFECPE